MIPTKNDQQLALNKTLVEQSGGLLAPLSGKERFVSVGTSHTCAFFRAAQANCKPPESCKGDIAADARCSAAPQRGGRAEPSPVPRARAALIGNAIVSGPRPAAGQPCFWNRVGGTRRGPIEACVHLTGPA